MIVGLRRRRRASSALFVVAVMATAGTIVLGAPAAARAGSGEPGSVATVTIDRWVPTGSVPIGAPLALSHAEKARPPEAVAPSALLRIIVPAADANEATAGPVLLVAEHTPQRQWDAWTALGFAVAHLQLPADDAGCVDGGGPADRAAMQSALAFLDGSGPGFADRAGTVETGAHFSDHRVAAVGDGTGGSPLVLGTARIRAVVATNAVIRGFEQQRWLASRPSGAPDPACPGAVADPGDPAGERWWRIRDHLPRTGYVAPTLVVQALGAGADVSPAQGLAAARALDRLDLPHQVQLTVDDHNAVDVDAAITGWLRRFVLDQPVSESPAPVVLHRGPASENLAQWPYPDVEPARLAGRGTGELAVGPAGTAVLKPPLRTAPLSGGLELAGAPVLTGRFSGPAALHLELVGPDGTRSTVARGTVEGADDRAQQVVLSDLDVRIVSGTRLQISVFGDHPGGVADLTVDLPVRGGLAALVAALPPNTGSTAPTTSVAESTAQSSQPPSTGESTIPASTSSVVRPGTTASPRPAATHPSTQPSRTSTAPTPSGTADTGALPQPTTAPDDPPTPHDPPTSLSASTADPSDQQTAGTDEPGFEPGGGQGAEPGGGPAVSTPAVGTSATPGTSRSPAPPTGQSQVGPTPTTGQPVARLPGRAQRGIPVAIPRVLSMQIENHGAPVDLERVALRGVDTTAGGRLHPIRVLDPGARTWNLTGQVSDFRSDRGTIVADNLGWRPSVTPILGDRGSVEPGPSVSPGRGSGLGEARVLCSGTAPEHPAIATCAGDLRLGVPGSARAGEYTALLTLTLI